MSLARLEQDFQALVLEGSAGIEHAIVGTARVPIATRLAVYTEAYGARLTEALEHNYPQLARLLGTQQFAAMARLYIRAHPSAHFSIRWFGAELATFLSCVSPYAERALLSELARWEWAMTLAFDAADAPLFTRAMLEQCPPEEWGALRLITHPSMQLLSMLTNAPQVWGALSRNETPPPETRNSVPREWLLWRRGVDTMFRSLEDAEACALRVAGAGESFGAMCEMLAAELGEEQAPAEAARLLARWLADELLCATSQGT